MKLNTPYIIFLGDVCNLAYAKTAFGLAKWSEDKCLAQLRYPECKFDLGIPDMSIKQAVAEGAKSLILGAAPVGGAIQENWIPSILESMEAGMDIVSGMHTKLTDDQRLQAAAGENGSRLIDIRVAPKDIAIATGKKRTGKRLLTVGTDCAVGKKYTALSIEKTLKSRGVDCDFRATGQTGIMIAGEGVAMDAVVSDFAAGAAEQLSPDNDPEHWDIIEGQGSLFNPAYAGVSLGLLHGSQPDAIVLCHDPSRQHSIGCPDHAMPDIRTCINTNLQLGALTNAGIDCVGLSINTSTMRSGERQTYLEKLSAETQLPCVDPLVEGVDLIVDKLLQI